jgi:hypothetical protein
MTQQTDDGVRGVSGVIASIVVRDDGRAWLVFDDVGRAGDAPPYEWKPEFFYTRVELDTTDLLTMQLDEKDYTAIGHAIVARLAAHHETRNRFTRR